MAPQVRRTLGRVAAYVALAAYGSAWGAERSTDQRVLFGIAAAAYVVGVIVPAIVRARAASAAGLPLWRRPTPERLAKTAAVLLLIVAFGYVVHKEVAIVTGLGVGVVTVAIVQIAAWIPPRRHDETINA